jgi:hypothetical protein
MPASSASSGAMDCARAAALAWRASLMHHRGIDVDHEGIGARHVSGDKVHLALHQAADEMHVAGKPV